MGGWKGGGKERRIPLLELWSNEFRRKPKRKRWKDVCREWEIYDRRGASGPYFSSVGNLDLDSNESVQSEYIFLKFRYISNIILLGNIFYMCLIVIEYYSEFKLNVHIFIVEDFTYISSHPWPVTWSLGSLKMPEFSISIPTRSISLARPNTLIFTDQNQVSI